MRAGRGNLPVKVGHSSRMACSCSVVSARVEQERLYVCMYVCMYVCVCLYVYMDMYVNMYIYVCMHIYIYICMYTCICVYFRPVARGGAPGAYAPPTGPSYP